MAWIIFSLDALPYLIHGRDMEKGQFLKPSSIASHCAVRSDMAIFCAMRQTKPLCAWTSQSDSVLTLSHLRAELSK
jgi:hypothetical protein